MSAPRYSNIVTEHLRLAILQVLEQDTDYAHNEIVLQGALEQLGHGVSFDRLRTELAWLGEQGLVAVSEVAGLSLDKLTLRGADAAKGRTDVPGVARPRPGG